jgi:hypothetical protein
MPWAVNLTCRAQRARGSRTGVLGVEPGGRQEETSHRHRVVQPVTQEAIRNALGLRGAASSYSAMRSGQLVKSCHGDQVVHPAPDGATIKKLLHFVLPVLVRVVDRRSSRG